MLLEFDLRVFIRLLPAILCGALLGSCDRQSTDAEQAQPDVAGQFDDGEKIAKSGSGLTGRLDIGARGSKMPVAEFASPNGTPVTLADFRGKPLLVNLWATWCAPCVIEMPTLDALAAREEDRLQVLVVSQDIQGQDIVGPFFKSKDFDELQPYTDTENGLGFAYATGFMPTTVLYDANGKEVWRVIGGMEWDGTRAAALLEDTLDNPRG